MDRVRAPRLRTLFESVPMPIPSRHFRHLRLLAATAAAAAGLFLLGAAPASSQTMTHKDISAQQAYEMMQSGAPLRIIDVRTPEEFAQGHIAGAVNVPLDAIEAGRIPFVMADKQATYLLYCRSGRRSGIAAEKLAGLGWAKVFNFGGILDWPYGTVR